MEILCEGYISIKIPTIVFRQECMISEARLKLKKNSCKNYNRHYSRCPMMLVFKLLWKLGVLCKGESIGKTEANCGKSARRNMFFLFFFFFENFFILRIILGYGNDIFFTRRNIEITLLKVYFRI